MRSLCERLLDKNNKLLKEFDKATMWKALENIYDMSGVKSLKVSDTGILIEGDLSVKKGATNLKLPTFNIYKVVGGFYCYNDNITSLEGCPTIIDGSMYCSSKKLASLEGGPIEVTGTFSVSSEKLRNLKESPELVGNTFCVSNCPSLVSMEGTGTVGNKIVFETCPNLTSIKNLSSAVSEIFFIKCSGLSSLNGLPNKLKGKCKISISDCPNIRTLEGLPKNIKIFFATQCDGLASIEGLPPKMKTVGLRYLNSLTSIKGMPSVITSRLILYGTDNITDIDSLNSQIGGSIFVSKDSPYNDKLENKGYKLTYKFL